MEKVQRSWDEGWERVQGAPMTGGWQLGPWGYLFGDSPRRFLNTRPAPMARSSIYYLFYGSWAGWVGIERARCRGKGAGC